MSSAPSTSEQSLLTRNNLQNGEEKSEQDFSPSRQHIVADDHVQHPTQASEEAYILDKDKIHSSSPLTTGSSADMAIVPPSPTLLIEGAVNDDGYKLTTLASSDVTPNIGCTETALPLPKPVVEPPAMSRDLSASLGDTRISQVNPLGVASMDFPCDGASSGDPQITLLSSVPDCSPCLAPDSALEIKLGVADDISDDAELFMTCHATYIDHRLSSGPTNAVSSPDASDKTDPLSVDSDARFTPRDSLIYENILSQGYEAGTPSLSTTPGALLTPPLGVDSPARDSSPSHLEPGSDVFMHSTPLPSSPQIGSNLAVIKDSTRDKDASYTDDHAEIDDYPAMAMSSPNLTLHGDEFSFSSSPPHQTTGTKNARYDDSDEESISAKPMKRIRTDDTMSSPLRNPPAPRHATLASQKRSRKKLVAPFRSPLRARTTSTQPTTPTLPREDAREQIAREPRAKYQIRFKSAQEPPAGTSKAIKSLGRSSGAATQFRSPLVKVPEHTPRPFVLPNQTIMNLEHKLTILRRAIKIKRDGDEAHLECLAKKWRDAGREAAYDLWGIVRDLSTEGGETRGNGNDSGWGWDKQGERGTLREDAVDADAEEGGEHAEKRENTLGIMLRRLGIAPETLGWNEEEETFVDDECE